MESTKDLPHLTPAELDVMKVLWSAERLSAREVHDRLAEKQGWAYSTTRTTLERMVKKGLITKKAFHGLHIYEPRISRAMGLAKMVKDFAGEVLEMDYAPVVSLFAKSNALTREELTELRRLLEKPAGGED
ncbi:BlaI/MecI/CopY family transcriptional regulator [Acidobacteriota bacterium]